MRRFITLAAVVAVLTLALAPVAAAKTTRVPIHGNETLPDVVSDGSMSTWTASWTGTVEAGYTTHRMEGVSIGSGDYAGLEFRWSQIGTPGLIVQVGTIGPQG